MMDFEFYYTLFKNLLKWVCDFILFFFLCKIYLFIFSLNILAVVGLHGHMWALPSSGEEG